MKLYNTLTKDYTDLTPLDGACYRVYSCGPTVYDHAHIGNLSSFVFVDTLKRTLLATGSNMKHVMNFTDIDDKTIRKSQEQYPDEDPIVGLSKVTRHYEELFLTDLEKVGFDTSTTTFLRATEHMNEMLDIIRDLYASGIAYIGDDGVYFSIEAYKKAGKKYGQLVEITAESTGSARVKNDEYDKDHVHDFALWKLQKDGEPAWEFELDGHNLLGRPGWHIECSAMSKSGLGTPFDIHTGGIDLAFPHHENEIAQSTAVGDENVFASVFAHNEHVMVDGKKMSKSLGNFYTLTDILERNYDPLAFRLLVLQAHYRSQLNFTFESLEAAQNRLNNWRSIAQLKYQTGSTKDEGQSTKEGLGPKDEDKETNKQAVMDALADDINTPIALALIGEQLDSLQQSLTAETLDMFNDYLSFVDSVLGLDLSKQQDITSEQKELLEARRKAREEKNWAESDRLRDELKEQGISVKDSASTQLWYR